MNDPLQHPEDSQQAGCPAATCSACQRAREMIARVEKQLIEQNGMTLPLSLLLGMISEIVSEPNSVIGRSPAALSQDLPDKPEQNH